MIQGSEEWLQARVGNITPSRIIDIVKGRSGYRASRDNYIAEIVCERLTGTYSDGIRPTQAMQWGTDTEPLARAAYEATTGNLVAEVGYVPHPDIAHFGGSPDGLVGDDGLTEYKCPNTATHLQSLLRGIVKKDYIYQMHGYMIITDREWCDFVSYDPRLPDEHSLYIKRFERDDKICDEILVEVGSVLVEVEHMLDRLKERVA